MDPASYSRRSAGPTGVLDDPDVYTPGATEHLAGKEFFTEEEAAALHQQFTAEGVDPSARNAINIEDAEAREKRLYQTNRDATYVHYDNEIWLRTRVPKGLSSRRTSLIKTDPPDGRLPALTPEAEQRAADRAAARRQRGTFDGYETRPLSERCIAWPHNGPPMMPPAYNDVHQIFQTPDYVVVHTELSNNNPTHHPLDGRPHISDNIRLFPGDSRGRWEGETLVVETRNFTDKTTVLVERCIPAQDPRVIQVALEFTTRGDQDDFHVRVLSDGDHDRHWRR